MSRRQILPLIVIAQFACTSLWFAGNAILPDLLLDFQLPQSVLGHITSAVQLGFIAGTLVYAIFSLADRFPPARVFLLSALAAAVANVGLVYWRAELWGILLLRFGTGFFLAGIYPVGMKIAADYFERGLGKALGYLVGALVLGTAFPHLLKGLGTTLSWPLVLQLTSGLAVTGGLLLWWLVPDGPYRRPSQRFDASAIFKVFRKPSFRAAALGYFGHMWELYAFWAFIPVILSTYGGELSGSSSILAFSIIAIGGVACVGGGYLAQWRNSAWVARLALLISGACCLLSPGSFFLPAWLFIAFLLIWGMAVVADSPQCSTLVAHYAPPELKGTALTIVNCIGFAITIFSIQLLNQLQSAFDPTYIYMCLAIGPFLGWWALRRLY